MKLKNPRLETSFTFILNNKVRYVEKLEVSCSLCGGMIMYFLRGFSTYDYNVLIPSFIFESAEEAFTTADRICSEYPPLVDDVGFPLLVDFPEFDKEIFKS